MEEQESRRDENIHLTRFLRVLANFFALCTLAGSGYLIYFVVRRSQKFALEGLENYGWWERNEVCHRLLWFLKWEDVGLGLKGKVGKPIVQKELPISSPLPGSLGELTGTGPVH